MMNAQLIALSREMGLRRELDVIANNLANLNTTGFKGEAVAFEDYMMPVANASAFHRMDRKLAYVQDWATVRDVSSGSIELTNNPLDVAIEGNGYLVVDTPAGERYTKNGALQINPDGVLVSNEGYPIKGLDGVIQFESQDADVAIASDGSISTEGGLRGRLMLVQFDNEQAMQKEGTSLYSGEGALPAETARVVQGAVERSNIQPIREMARMVEIQRAYEMQARLIGEADNLRRNAIEKLGRLT